MSQSQPKPSPKSILVVDDTPANLLLLNNILREAGYEVRPVPRGKLALRAAQASPPDLILLDINMPELNGYEVCRQLKANEKTQAIPVIFISASDETLDKVVAFTVGGVDYITKPFQNEEVLARVKTHIALQGLQKQLQQANTNLSETNIALETSNLKLIEINQQLAYEINERKRAEQKLQLTQFTVDNAVDIIFWIGQDGRLVYVNEATCRLLGYTHQELMTMTITDIDSHYPPEVWASHWENSQERAITVETRHQHKTGQPIPVEVTFTYLEFGGQAYNVAFARDSTWRHWAIEELQKSEKQQRILLERLQQEMALAQDIQQSLLPPTHPNWPNLDIVCYMQPAREVGGDFYSYHAFPVTEDNQEENKYALAVGDVSGKGVSAALLMATSLSLFGATISKALPPSKLLTQLDQALKPYAKPSGQNCALCYIELILTPSHKNKAGVLHIANAACIPPYIRQANNTLESPEIGGFALGQGLGGLLGYQEITLPLSSGDLIILTSDGVVEANNLTGDMLGFEQLETILKTGPTDNAQAMLTHLKQQVFAFTQGAEQHDDLTIVVIQV